MLIETDVARSLSAAAPLSRRRMRALRREQGTDKILRDTVPDEQISLTETDTEGDARFQEAKCQLSIEIELHQPEQEYIRNKNVQLRQL